METKKYKLAATFKYGRIWGDFALSMVIVLAISITSGFAYLSLAFFGNKNPTASVFVLLVDIFLLGLFTVELIRGCKNRLYANKCIKDSIEIITTAKFYDKDTNFGRQYKGIKISVSFHYNKKKIQKHSVFDMIFERYLDKEIKILYSPTYDEVLIVRE